MNDVFKSASKAETALKNIEKRRSKSHELVDARYDQKRQSFIDGLDVQTRAALRFTAVLAPLDAAPYGTPDESPGFNEARALPQG